MSSSKPAVRTYTLRPFRELRILNDNMNLFENSYLNSKNVQNQMPTVKLLNQGDRVVVGGGKKHNEKAAVCSAEIFGAELLIDYEYVIKPNVRMAIYTWGGCSLQVRGAITQEYYAPNNAMKEYLNFAYVLDAQRELALLKNKIGPKVLVTGSGSSGKSSICHILCNYALKTSWNCIYVELDPRCSTDKEQLSFLPGVIGATVIESFEDNEPQAPLCYYYGHFDVHEDKNLFLKQCECLSAAIHMHFAFNLKKAIGVKKKNKNIEGTERYTAASGLIINAPFQPSAYLVTEIVHIFGVNIVAVVDNPSLQFNIEQKFCSKLPEKESDVNSLNSQQNEILVLGLPKQDGVVSVDNDRLRYLRRSRWNNYFNGTFDKPLRPTSLRIRFVDIHFVTLDTFTSLPHCSASDSTSAEHFSSSSSTTSCTGKGELIILDWHGAPRSLLNVILGVPAATEKELIPSANLACFVYVKNVEEIEAAKVVSDDVISQESDHALNLSKFVLDLWCPYLAEGKLMSNFLIVPADLRQIKWLTEIV